jgi:hypothetical protein
MQLIEYKIRTGDYAKVKRGNLQGSLNLIYSGMPSPDRFALTPIIDEGFLMEGFKFTATIYYPAAEADITVLGDDFKVSAVSPTEITLQFVKY